MLDKQQEAKHLYFTEQLTQRQIAERIGVTERTIYNWIKQFAWDKLKQASYEAPALIAENISSQIVELQNEIRSREPGKRYPTPQEAETTRKLVSCLDKLKKYPTLPQSMQVLATFKDYTKNRDNEFTSRLAVYSSHFVEEKAKNGFSPYQLEYGEGQVSPMSPYTGDDSEIKPMTPPPPKTRQEIMADAEALLIKYGRKTGNLFSEEKVAKNTAETLDCTALHHFPVTPSEPEKTGNSTSSAEPINPSTKTSIDDSNLVEIPPSSPAFASEKFRKDYPNGKIPENMAKTLASKGLYPLPVTPVKPENTGNNAQSEVPKNNPPQSTGKKPSPLPHYFYTGKFSGKKPKNRKRA